MYITQAAIISIVTVYCWKLLLLQILVIQRPEDCVALLGRGYITSLNYFKEKQKY